MSSNPDSPSSLTLHERVASLRARPFTGDTVQTPWSTVVDSEELHSQVKSCIRQVVKGCGDKDTTRCLTIIAPTGYGKTHLLAWTRQILEEEGITIFAYIPPYLPGPHTKVDLEQHVLASTVDALRSFSRRQRDRFDDTIRKRLVASYDQIIESGSGGRIGAGTTWWRLFQPSDVKIKKSGIHDQLSALQKAFTYRAFFDLSYREFSEAVPGDPSGCRLDRDTYVAASLLACGNVKQRWYADEWFHSLRIPSDVLQPYHIERSCQGTDNIRNALYTLQSLVGQPFCLVFDQIEDTYSKIPQEKEKARAFVDSLGILLRNLSVIPRFCVILSCQQSVWKDFAELIPPMLRDRLTQEYGAQSLDVLSSAAAQDVYRVRMQAAVWSQLMEAGPPEEYPYFPFTLEEIEQFRKESNRELRAFIRRLQVEYDARLQSPVPRHVRLPIQLTSIEPREVLSHEASPILLRGQYFPTDVRVLFNGQPTSDPPVCRSDVGEIDVTTPTGLLGDIQVRVEAFDDPTNGAVLILRVIDREVPRPYRDHLDGTKFRKERESKGLNQTDVAQRLSTKQPKISEAELNKRYASDDLYARLAEFYGKPLSDFLRS